MNVLKKITIIILGIFLTLSAILFAANQGLINTHVRNITNFILKINGTNAKIKGVKIYHGDFKISEIRFFTKAGTAKILNLDGKWNFNLSGIKASLDSADLKILNQKEEEILQAQLLPSNIQFCLGSGISDYDINLQKISSETIKNIDGEFLKDGIASFRLSDEISGKIKFSNSEYLFYGSDAEKKNLFKINANKFPLMLHSVLPVLISGNKLVEFLDEFVEKGYVNNLDISFDESAENFDEKKLSGTGKIVNLEVCYDYKFPNVKSMELDIKLSGKDISFGINKAYSSDMLLQGGKIQLDWKGQDNTVVYIKSSGKGPASSIVDFIDIDILEALKKGNIDLKKIDGLAELMVEVAVPLKEKTKNQYNITAKIPDSSLSIFKDLIKMKKTDLSGKFDGDKVIISGNGKINDFNSKLNFIHNIEQGDFNNEMSINIDINIPNKLSNKEKKLPFISLLGGDGKIDLSYKNIGDDHDVIVRSDLTKLNLYFDKLGIHKDLNQKADLLFEGKFQDLLNGKGSLKITGENKLNILSEIDFKENDIKLNFKEIKHNLTDIKGVANFIEDKLIAKFYGDVLDLSKADFFQFLEKERDASPVDLEVTLDKLILKNNIKLDKTSLGINCDATRCYKGYLKSYLNKRAVNMNLKAKGEFENWHIKAGRAGQLFAGLGLYENLRNGDIDLKFSTTRKLVKSGDKIPVVSGEFILKRFKLSETPTLTKLAGFVSVPGFVNVIMGKSDIAFYKMVGNFSFEDKILKIENSFAKGPFFDFQLKGNIDSEQRIMDIHGFVNPSLYGISLVIDYIPIVNKIFVGNRKKRGLISAPYKIKEKF